MDHDSPEQKIRLEAGIKAENLESIRQTREAKRSVLNWLCGSVVAFNAAGLAASLSFVEKLDHPAAAAMIFVAALVLCIVTAVVYLDRATFMIDAFESLVNIMDVPASERNLDKLNEALQNSAQVDRKLVPVALSGLSAGLFTIGGAVFFALNFNVHDAANIRRCKAIQVDMLSAHPRRSDGPDLFQALGCRPQGPGGVSAPPTDRERNAGHPLPWGGYPPSR